MHSPQSAEGTGRQLTPSADSASSDLYYRLALSTNDAGAQIIIRGSGQAMFEYLQRVEERGLLARMAPLSMNVLVFMLLRMNGKQLREKGRMVCWPSLGYLAVKCKKHRGHVQRAVTELRELGLLRKLKQQTGSKSRKYELVIPRVPQTLARGVSGRKSCPLVLRRRNTHSAPAQHCASAGALDDSAPARYKQRRLKIGELKGATEKPSETTTATLPASAAAAVVVPDAGGTGGRGESGKGSDGREALLVAEKFEPDSIERILAHPNCTEAQIRIAIALANRCKKFEVSRPAFIRSAIERKYAPPLTAEQRREENRQDGQREAESLASERARAIQAQIDTARRQLSAMTPEQLRERLRRQARIEPQEFWRTYFDQKAKDGAGLKDLLPCVLPSVWNQTPTARAKGGQSHA